MDIAPIALVLLAILACAGRSPGQSASFNGNQWLDTAVAPTSSPTLMGGPDMTVEFWFKNPAFPLPPASANFPICGRAWSTGGAWWIDAHQFATCGLGSQYSSYVDDSTGWNHYAMVWWSGPQGTQSKFLINGKPSAINSACLSVPVIADPFTIGKVGPAIITGLLDELRIWSVARTDQEIRDNMFLELTTHPDLAHVWHFNGDTVDSAGNVWMMQVSTGLPPGPFAFTATDTPIQATQPTGFPFLQTINAVSGLIGEVRLQHASAAAGLDVYVLCDTSAGNVPLGPFGFSQLAFSPDIFGLADPTGTFAPASVNHTTDVTGVWRTHVAIPASASGVTVFCEAYIIQPALAPNSLFFQSNLVTVVVQ